MKRILVLSDGRPGHYNQSLAVADAVEEIESAEVRVMEVKVKKSTKYLLRMMLNSNIGRKWLQQVMRPEMISWFYDGYVYEEKPDIVISSGKDTSMLNALLGLMYGVKTLFIGNPKKLDHRLFTAVLTLIDLGFDNQVVLDVAPTRRYRGDIETFCKEHRLDPHATYYTLLIGGDGSGYRYSEKEYEKLIDLVNHTKEDVKWLVTTSRRTPLEMEMQMQKKMNTAMFVAYNQKPQKVIGAFLALSDVVFVTEESASMVSEAVASGKKVVTLVPEVVVLDKNYGKILNKFEDEEKIKRVQCADIGGSDKIDIDMEYSDQNHILQNFLYRFLKV